MDTSILQGLRSWRSALFKSLEKITELDFWLLDALQTNKNRIYCKNLLVVIISYQAELMLMSLINS